MGRIRLSLLLPLLLLVFGFAASAIAANPCAGSGQQGSSPPSCVGGCGGGTACTHQNSAGNGDPLGGWKYCGCAGTTEYTCCHLIFRKILDSENWEYSVTGDCISCPLNGSCQRGGSGTLLSPYQAECALP